MHIAHNVAAHNIKVPKRNVARRKMLHRETTTKFSQTITIFFNQLANPIFVDFNHDLKFAGSRSESVVDPNYLNIAGPVSGEYPDTGGLRPGKYSKQ
jgi:hypothetical protein